MLVGAAAEGQASYVGGGLHGDVQALALAWAQMLAQALALAWAQMLAQGLGWKKAGVGVRTRFGRGRGWAESKSEGEIKSE